MRVTRAPYAANILTGLLLLMAAVLLPAGAVFAAYDVTISGNSSINGAWSGGSPDVWTPSGTGANVSVGEIRTRLNGGINVEISTGGAGSAGGNIDFNAVTTWNAGVLTLTAQKDITINAIMTVSAPAGLSMNYGAQGGIKVGLAPGEGQGYIGRVDFPGRSGKGFLTINGENYTVIKTLGVEGSATTLDLQGISGDLAGKYALGANIDASATAAGWNQNSGFEPLGDNISPFTGVFDGLGHTINGLKIDRSYDKWVGLFGYTAATTVLRNLGLAGGSLNGQDSVGGLAGYAAGLISNCYNSGLRVDGSDTAGGLVGINSATITDSYSTGTVNSTTAPGGLVGDNLDGSISYSYATGNVIGTDYVGGLVGYNTGLLLNSYARGIVFGNQQVGGLVGRNDLGFVLSDISDSYATGFVNGMTDVGGLVGWNDDPTSVNAGFWDTLTSNQTASDGGMGKTTAEMKQLATFVAAGWDISANESSTSVWRMIEGQSYPQLRRFVPPLSTAISKTATSITTSSATLNGTVNARYADTTVRFEYGPTAAYGASLAAIPASVLVGSGDTPVNVPISGLTAAKTYHYRVVATNSLGTVYGDDVIVVADKVLATVTLGDLNHTFDGSAKNAAAATNPSGKIVIITYNGSATPPTNAGSYAVIATISDSYYQGSATGTLTIAKAAATVALTGLSQTFDGSTKAVVATTAPAGLSTVIKYNGSETVPTLAGSYTVVATITDGNYSGSASGTLIIAKATPSVTWAAPAAMYLGSTLSGIQLNATSNASGSFVYTPAAGTVMNTIGTQTLSAAFTPADAANYNNATASASITVNSKLNPVITWAAPAAIAYGNALSDTQLNATASVAGAFSYTPASGAVLSAGSQTLTVTFTPADTLTYNTATKTVSLTVNKTAATITLSGLIASYDGSAKSVSATTSPAGKTVAITYDGSSTAPSAAGSYAVLATIIDANYSGSTFGTLVIALPTLTVAVTANGTQSTGIGGTVTSSPSGISCNNSVGGGPVVICTNSFSGTVNLYATPSALSVFGGWGGGECSGTGVCSVTINGDKTVTATFNQATLLQINGTAYPTLQSAYNAANQGAVVQMLDNTVAGTLDANRGVTVKLKGGYDTGYKNNAGTTAVSAPLIVRLGTVEIDRIVVK